MKTGFQTGLRRVEMRDGWLTALARGLAAAAVALTLARGAAAADSGDEAQRSFQVPSNLDTNVCFSPVIFAYRPLDPDPEPMDALLKEKAGRTFYVSNSGNDANDGSAKKPWKTLLHARKTISGGSLVLLEPGQYFYDEKEFDFGPEGTEKDKTVWRFKGGNHWRDRVLITTQEGFTPAVKMKDFTRIEGMWIGGLRGKGSSFSFACRGGELVRNVLWNGQGGSSGSTAREVLIQENLIVRMGSQVNREHALNISGGPDDLGSPLNSSDIWVVNNVILAGGGRAISCWDRPANVTAIGNFASGQASGAVFEGGGHVVHHNVWWENYGPLHDGVAGQPRWNAWIPNVQEYYENLHGGTTPLWEMWKGLEECSVNFRGRSDKPNYFIRLRPYDPYCRMLEDGKKYCGNQILFKEVKDLSLDLPWFKRQPHEIEEAYEFITSYLDYFQDGMIHTDNKLWERMKYAWDVLCVNYPVKAEELKARPIPANVPFTQRAADSWKNQQRKKELEAAEKEKLDESKIQKK